MLAEDIYAIMLFSSLILVVPGPSNTLLLSAGFHFGSLRAAPFILLEALGYSLSIFGMGLGIGAPVREQSMDHQSDQGTLRAVCGAPGGEDLECLDPQCRDR